MSDDTRIGGRCFIAGIIIFVGGIGMHFGLSIAMIAAGLILIIFGSSIAIGAEAEREAIERMKEPSKEQYP